jgi:hypothetical protein
MIIVDLPQVTRGNILQRGVGRDQQGEIFDAREDPAVICNDAGIREHYVD